MKGAQKITMALLNRKNPKNSLWKDVEKQSHALISQILQEKLPLTNLNKLDLSQDEDYLQLLSDYQVQHVENSLEMERVAHEIAYEYLLIAIKSLIGTLKEFTCHDPEYLEGVV